MKIENLKVGMEFKNWNYLCEALEVQPKPSGKARKPQEKEFKKYFDWTKQGQRITITEIKKSTSAIPNNIELIRDNESTFFHPVTKELIEGEVLSMYQSIIKQVDGNTLRDLICKSIINNLFIQLSTVGQVGFRDAWFVTNAELLKNTGLVSPSYDYVKRNPKRFCNEMPELTEENLDEVLDHLNVNKDWLKNKTKKALEYLANQYHLITYTSEAYRFVMKTTRIKNGVAYTHEEDYLPTLDEIEWINVHVIPTVLKQHKNKYGQPYKKINDLKYDGKIQEFYQEWIPNYINNNLPTGWGIVTEVYKCHRIGFSQDIIEYAVNNHMRLLYHERQILDELAECYLMTTKNQVTDDRNKQVKKRHEQAVKNVGKCDEETRQIRSRGSYIGVGYVVNRELHSSEASYRDFTKYDTNASKTIVSKITED